MNWDAIGAIGEIIGATAVVISLVYLASQIRISNRASRQAAEQNLLDNVRIWMGRIAESESLSDIWARGSKNDPSMSEAEWIRFGTLCNEITLHWERSQILAKDGDISSSVLERDQRLRKAIIGAPGYHRWFETRKFALTDEIVEQIEREMKDSDPYTIPYAGFDSQDHGT